MSDFYDVSGEMICYPGLINDEVRYFEGDILPEV